MTHIDYVAANLKIGGLISVTLDPATEKKVFDMLVTSTESGRRFAAMKRFYLRKWGFSVNLVQSAYVKIYMYVLGVTHAFFADLFDGHCAVTLAAVGIRVVYT